MHKSQIQNSLTPQYYRSCVIVIEWDSTRNILDQEIILFENTKWNKFAIPGGKKDKTEQIEKTAIRELAEETANLFSLQNLHNYFDMYDKKVKAFNRVYYIFIEPNTVQTNLFYKNKKKISQRNKKYCWNETKNISRFKLAHFSNLQPGCDIHCTDTQGTERIIYGDTRHIMEAFLQQDIKIVITPLKRQKSASKTFLKNTIFYTNLFI